MNTRDRQNLARKLVGEAMRDGRPTDGERSATIREICVRCSMSSEEATSQYDHWSSYFEKISKEQSDKTERDASETPVDTKGGPAAVDTPAALAAQAMEEAERAALLAEIDRQIAEGKSNLSAIASQLGELKALLDAAHDPPLSQAENDALKGDHERVSLELMSTQAKLSALMGRKCELLEAMLQK